MKKKLLAISKKMTLFIIFIFSLTYNSTYSQCVNPTPTGAASQVFCKTDNSTIANLVANGGIIVWYDEASGGESYGTTEVLVNGITYYADDISGGSCSTSRLAVTVSIYGDFPTNVDVAVTKCAIDKPNVGNLSATGENIAWYDAQTGGNFLTLSTLLVNGMTYWVQQTENGCTSARFPTMVSLIDPITPTTAPIQLFCYPPNPTVANLKSSGTSVLWYDSETSITPLKTTTPLVNGEDYWVAEVTFPCVSSIRAQTTVVLDAAPDAGESSSLQECEVSFVTTNLFDLLGGTPNTTGIWTGPSALSNGYLGTFEPGINTVGTYTYTVSSVLGICPSDSATVAVTITVIPPPTITETTQSFCIADVASTPTLAELIVDTIGADSVVRWYADATSTIELPLTTTLVNNTTYFASQFDSTSNCESALRDSKTALIEIAPNAGTDGSYTDCEIDLVDTNLFTLLGGSPDVSGTWTAPDGTAHSGTFVAGTDVAGIYTYTVAGGTICPDDTAIVTVDITVIPAPIITDADQSFCIVDLASSPTLADLTVDTIGAGNVVRWYADATSTIELPLTTTLANNTTYFASQFDSTSNCESALRDSKTALIEIAPNAGTDGSYTDCEIDLVDTNLFTLLGGSPDVSGTWTAPDGTAHSGNFVAGTDVAGVYTYSVGGPTCTPDTAIVTVTITVVPAPSITNNNPSFCIVDTKTVGDLVVDDATATITWYDAAIGGNVIDPTTVLTTSSLWASQTNSSGCESVNRNVVNVTIIDLQTPITSANQSFCLAFKPTVASLAATGTNVLWFENETDDVTLALDSTIELEDNKTYWAADVDLVNGCESFSRTSTLVTLNDVAPVTITNISQTFCASDFPTIANLAVTGNGILWYATQTSTAPLLVTSPLISGMAYWAAQSNPTTGCVSSVRVVANVTLTAIKTPTLISLGNEFCKIDNPTIADLNLNVSANNGGTITWYDAYPNGNLLSASTALVEGKTYYAIETNVNGCKSINPLEVTVSLEACDAYDVVIYDGFSPTGNGVNDTFKLTNLRELYPDFKVEFFNRWGNLMYTANAGKPDWNGRLNGDGELSPAGVYYFVIYFNKNDRKPIQRRLYLSR
jgi:gliding motility-associated-like protein